MLYMKDINSTQEEREFIKQFITLLYTLVQTCDFPTSLQEEMIRRQNFLWYLSYESF